MNTPPRQLVLAITDPGLRSILAAQLGMAGEMPISTTDHLDPTLGKEVRSTALLIIEASLITSASQDWAETLRNQCWSGQIIIIAEKLPEHGQSDEKVVMVGKRDAGASILALVRLWQAQAEARSRARLTPPE